MIIFLITGLVFTALSVIGAPGLAWIMQAPQEAFEITSDYIRICGAFAVRIPIAFIMQIIGKGLLFLIGISIPCSTLLQIVMCLAAYFYFNKNSVSYDLKTDQQIICEEQEL